MSEISKGRELAPLERLAARLITADMKARERSRFRWTHPEFDDEEDGL